MQIAKLCRWLIAVVVISTCGCGKQGNVILRVQNGDAVQSMKLEGYTNGIPIQLALTDDQSVQCLSWQIANCSTGILLGNSFEAEVVLKSGYRETLTLMIPKGGQQFSVAVGQTILKEPIWYTVTIPADAPPIIVANFKVLAP